MERQFPLKKVTARTRFEIATTPTHTHTPFPAGHLEILYKHTTRHDRAYRFVMVVCVIWRLVGCVAAER